MEEIVSLLEVLNGFSPLGIIALLGVVIFMLVKGKEEKSENPDSHWLSQMADSLSRMESTLQRIEVKLSEDFSYIKGRINGGGGSRP
jgi:hypothetical protein